MIKDNELPYKTLLKMMETHECSCGSRLSVAWGGNWGYKGYVLRCGKDPSHRDFVRPFETTMGNDPDYTGWKLSRFRRRQLDNQIGQENTNKLMKYQGRITLTEPEVKDIIATIWPRAVKEAPDVVKRAILICLQYRLNPLMKQLHLLPFKDKEESKKQRRDVYSWAIARGIQADRLLARRQGPFSYIDNTPRKMTDEEQKQIFGKVDKDSFHAIVKLRDPSTGAESTGYGAWSHNSDVYGKEKGNTMENMAFIHAERQALDRLHPGDMPEDVMVVDERFLNLDKAAQLPPSTTKVIDVPKVEKVTEKTTEEPPPEEEKRDSAEPPPEEINTDMKVWLAETLKAIKWSEETAKSWISATFKIEVTGDLLKDVLPRMTKDQAARFTKELNAKASQQSLFPEK